VLGLLAFAVCGMEALAQTKRAAAQSCRAVSFDGEVEAGQPFRKVFTPGLEFFLEPLRSGWIVRVLEMRNGREVRGPHDWAEVATPPYRSVSPLLISTDWAFRAQDAVAWNPREFRYARDAKAFVRLSGDVERIESGQSAAEADVAETVMVQPQGALRVLDAAMVPGARDQAKMASMVALHLAETPHEVVQGVAPTPLGALRGMKFRVVLDLAPGAQAAKGLQLRKFSCSQRPTG
jgi:hypothetical protein